eukprot:COSAG01_NODE_60561_length_294_cov_0.753846_1_plen_42_part_01
MKEVSAVPGAPGGGGGDDDDDSATCVSVRTNSMPRKSPLPRT